MNIRIHPQARTTPEIRQQIKDSGLSEREIAKAFNITRATAAKWLKRDSVQDRSHRAHTLYTTLSPAQEGVVLALRQCLHLPLDDLLSITRQYVNEEVSRSGIARLLKREGMSQLEQLIPTAESETIAPRKTFKDEAPGYFQVAIQSLPPLLDDPSSRFAYLAIDRATRWMFVAIERDLSAASGVDFLGRLVRASPVTIRAILTTGARAFSDRLATPEGQPSGRHPFDLACAELAIAHRLPCLRDDGRRDAAVRLDARVRELLHALRVVGEVELEASVLGYVELYNHCVAQRATGGQTPVAALQAWHRQRPEIFVRAVCDRSALQAD
ncbi:MAG: IS481 family transposase [Pseudomonadota bacterium]